MQDAIRRQFGDAIMPPGRRLVLRIECCYHQSSIGKMIQRRCFCHGAQCGDQALWVHAEDSIHIEHRHDPESLVDCVGCIKQELEAIP